MLGLSQLTPGKHSSPSLLIFNALQLTLHPWHPLSWVIYLEILAIKNYFSSLWNVNPLPTSCLILQPRMFSKTQILNKPPHQIFLCFSTKFTLWLNSHFCFNKDEFNLLSLFKQSWIVFLIFQLLFLPYYSI